MTSLLRLNSHKAPIHAPPDMPLSPTDTDSIRSFPGPTALNSRFSDDTMFIKTPRTLSHHRWFSHGDDGPGTPGTPPVPPTPPIKLPFQLAPAPPPKRAVAAAAAAAAALADELEVLDSPPDEWDVSPLPTSHPHPPRPTRAIPSPPCPTPAEPRTISPTPACIARADLPPRSDSRNGFIPISAIANLIASQVKSPVEPVVDSQPVRPLAPPPADAPLLPRPSVSAPTPPITGQFRATLVQGPSSASTEKPRDSILVVLNVGGQSFTTTAETLVRDRRGGNLGSFVEAAIERVRERKGSPSRLGPIYPASSRIREDGDSLLSATHFDLSPAGSPFPFASYESSDESSPAEEITIPTSPTSPIDPFARRMFFRAPLPSLSIPSGQHPQLVSSPLPHLRITSVVPTICPTPSPHNASPAPPRRPSSHASDADDEAPWAPLHDLDPFENALGPFFKVLKDQSREETGPDGAQVVLPGDASTGSSLLAVPRAKVPKVAIARSEPASRPPSLSMSISTDEDIAPAPPAPTAPFEVFLDRASEPYAAVLAFLRDGQLPPELALPRSKTGGVDPTTLALLALHPPLAFERLMALRTLKDEAEWLALDDLEGACERESQRVVKVVLWMEERKRKEGIEDERKKRAEAMGSRGKAGWI